SQVRSLAKNGLSDCELRLSSRNGLIFATSFTPVSGTAKVPSGKAYSILVRDGNSNEVARIALGREEFGTLKSPFTWDLKSGSGSYVKSGMYAISLVELSDEEIECCSARCRVADTRDILSTTDMMKSTKRFTDPTASRVVSIYAGLIKDIQTGIIEKLKDNLF